MRSDLIRMTQPVWVRIVNPEPFSILHQSYRYGDVLRIRAGGIARIISDDGPRLLAVYLAPHAPYDQYECPSDALLYHTANDLRMMAEGKLSYELPLDPELRAGLQPAPTPPCVIKRSQTARVPADRRVRAMPPPIVKESKVGGPFREESVFTTEQKNSAKCMLRPGGILTALEHRGAHVKVSYAPRPDYNGEQCEAGWWFWMPAIDFILMETRYQTLVSIEQSEREEILCRLRAVEWRP